ncbi:hypothetical protein [Microbacterium nymphoidis]|uniref:hypothetical protein n=1 Tax=Microbacterium nymphoidis TaxID=2898586 RepID=UPI001E2CE588|nr:hypothetical protein [Microbacterium nymphoidis]MCD2499672.1 hypothetical protein [Microbacterium nymphoidis]
MTRWGAQFPVGGSAGLDSTGTDSAGDRAELTINRAQLDAMRARSASAVRDGLAPDDDDATISRDALNQLRRARRAPGVPGDNALDAHAVLGGGEVLDGASDQDDVLDDDNASNDDEVLGDDETPDRDEVLDDHETPDKDDVLDDENASNDDEVLGDEVLDDETPDKDEVLDGEDFDDDFDDDQTVSRAELDRRRGAARTNAATGARRLRRNVRSTADASSAAETADDASPSAETAGASTPTEITDASALAEIADAPRAAETGTASSPEETAHTSTPAETEATSSREVPTYTSAPAATSHTEIPEEAPAASTPAETSTTPSPTATTHTSIPEEAPAASTPAETSTTPSPAATTHTSIPEEAPAASTPAETSTTPSPAATTLTASPAATAHISTHAGTRHTSPLTAIADAAPEREDTEARALEAEAGALEADGYFRDASTIPYATLMSLRAAAAGQGTDHGMFVPRSTTPSDVHTSEQNVSTRSIRLPLPAAELAREIDEGDDEEVPEDTLPAPVTHDVAVSARANPARRSAGQAAPRTSAGLNDRPHPSPRGPRTPAGRTRPSGAGGPVSARVRRRPMTAARRRIVVLTIVAALATAIAVVVAVTSALRAPVAAPLSGESGASVADSDVKAGAGHGETNILIALADSPEDAADIASEGGAQAVAIAVVDFSADGSSVSSVSFRPDTWVAIPQHGEGTLSDALSMGGAEALRASMQDSLGIRIDHTMVITEPWLTGLALSGDLDIVNPSDIEADRFTFPTGPLTLTPSTAADYLMSDPRDLLRQQAVLDGAARVLIARGTPGGTTTDAGLVVLPAFTDSDLDQLNTQLRQVGASDIVYGVAATSDAERASRDVATLDGTAWRELRAAFAADDVAGHLRSGTSR